MTQMQPLPHSMKAINTDPSAPATAIYTVNSDPTMANTTDQQKQGSNTRRERLDKAAIRFSSTRMAIQIILALVYPPITLYYGINYLGQCPVQPLINIFLIVNGATGAAGALDLLLAYITAKHITGSSNPSPHARLLFGVCLIVQLVYFVFSIAWLVPGQVWVFGTQVNGYQSTNSSQSTTYCNYKVFSTGFGIIIASYVVFLIIILIACTRRFKEKQRMKQQAAMA